MNYFKKNLKVICSITDDITLEWGAKKRFCQVTGYSQVTNDSRRIVLRKKVTRVVSERIRIYKRVYWPRARNITEQEQYHRLSCIEIFFCQRSSLTMPMHQLQRHDWRWSISSERLTFALHMLASGTSITSKHFLVCKRNNKILFVKRDLECGWWYSAISHDIYSIDIPLMHIKVKHASSVHQTRSKAVYPLYASRAIFVPTTLCAQSRVFLLFASP